MKGRVISGVIAAMYLLVAYFTGGGKALLQVTGFLVLPLACIWFSDEMGGYTGIAMGRGEITSTTPGCLVTFGGWLLLFLPAIVGTMWWIMGR